MRRANPCRVGKLKAGQKLAQRRGSDSSQRSQQEAKARRKSKVRLVRHGPQHFRQGSDNQQSDREMNADRVELAQPMDQLGEEAGRLAIFVMIVRVA